MRCRSRYYALRFVRDNVLGSTLGFGGRLKCRVVAPFLPAACRNTARSGITMPRIAAASPAPAHNIVFRNSATVDWWISANVTFPTACNSRFRRFSVSLLRGLAST
jgi:hypothetical protein